MKARLLLKSENRRAAEAIANALNPDNTVVPQGMSILTKAKDTDVVTEIRFSGSVQTLTSTIDDLLKCAQAAERAIKTILEN